MHNVCMPLEVITDSDSIMSSWIRDIGGDKVKPPFCYSLMRWQMIE